MGFQKLVMGKRLNAAVFLLQRAMHLKGREFAGQMLKSISSYGDVAVHVSATDSHGRTLLHYAVIRCFRGVAQMLRGGCKTDVVDGHGKSAYDYHFYDLGDRVITRDDSLFAGLLGAIRSIDESGMCRVWLWKLDSLDGRGLPGDGRVVSFPSSKLRPGPTSRLELVEEMMKVLNESVPEAMEEVFRSPFVSTLC